MKLYFRTNCIFNTVETYLENTMEIRKETQLIEVGKSTHHLYFIKNIYKKFPSQSDFKILARLDDNYILHAQKGGSYYG